jgi:hypothetical protein
LTILSFRKSPAENFPGAPAGTPPGKNRPPARYARPSLLPVKYPRPPPAQRPHAASLFATPRL